MNNFIESTVHNWTINKLKTQSNIYIIPSRFGFYYIVINFLSFMIGLTYGNNLALLISFILVSYFIMVMINSHFNLKHFNFINLTFNSNFQDNGIGINLISKNDSKNTISDIHVYNNRRNEIKFCEIENISGVEEINFKNTIFNLPRGYYSSPHILLRSQGPNFLFSTWSYLKTPSEFYVYPKRIQDSQLFNALTDNINKNQWDEDSYETHINYHSSLNHKRIDWKRFSKTNQLLWKKYSAMNYNALNLDYDLISGDPDSKLGKLSWLVDWAHKQNIEWSLKLPGETLPQQKGAHHYRKCLEKLAIL